LFVFLFVCLCVCLFVCFLVPLTRLHGIPLLFSCLQVDVLRVSAQQPSLASSWAG
jgi:hypothetical protein